jgi:hypothetical protein
VLFFATGPPQPDIEVEEEDEPSALRISKVPQNAKDVLVEPVLLKIDNLNVLYTESPAMHVLQRSVPGKVAPVSVKSFDVHELGEGNVCATAFEKNKTAGKKISSKLLMVAANQALC